MTANTEKFTARSIAADNGTVYPVTWHLYAGDVVAEIRLPDGKTATVTIDEHSEHFYAAHSAAMEAQRLDAEEAAAEKERLRAEKRAARAADPAKQAHGPAREMDFVGQMIRGIGYRVEFSRTYDRTMIRFDSIPSDNAREIVKGAGFFWSPSLGAWVKGLNWRAYRAALAVTEQLSRLPEPPCKAKKRSA